MHQRAEQAAELADDSKGGFGGKFVADRDGGGDVVTGRAKEVTEGGGHCRAIS